MIWDAFYNRNIDQIGWFRYLYRSQVPFILSNLILLENYIINERFLSYFKKIFVVTVIIGVVFSTIQLLINPYFFVPSHYEEYFRTTILYAGTDVSLTVKYFSVFGYTELNELGFSFIPLVFAFLGVKIAQKEKDYYLFLGLSFVIILFSNSRYAQLSIIIFLVMLVYGNRKKVTNYFKFILVSFIIVMVGFYVLDVLNISFADYRDQRLFSKTSDDRVNAFYDFGYYFNKNILFGLGYEPTLYFKEGGGMPILHVGYLSHTAAYGIFGSFLLFSIWIMLLIKFYKTGKNKEFYGGFFMMIFFLFANMTLPRYDLFSYGIVYTIMINNYYERLPEEESENTTDE